MKVNMGFRVCLSDWRCITGKEQDMIWAREEQDLVLTDPGGPSGELPVV